MGIQLFFTNPQVALQEEFSSSALAQANRAGMDVAQRGRGGKPFGPPMLGRDDLSALGVTSANPPSCQTLTLLHGETANPSGSAIPPLRRGRGGGRVPRAYV